MNSSWCYFFDSKCSVAESLSRMLMCVHHLTTTGISNLGWTLRTRTRLCSGVVFSQL